MPASRGAPSTRLPWQRASLTDAYLPDWSYSFWDWEVPPGRNGKRVNGSEHARMVRDRAAFLRKVLLLPRPQSTSAVVSLMWSYTLERMRRFVGTLRAHYHGDVLLLMSARPPPDIQDYLVAQRVTQVPIAPIGDIAVELSTLTAAYGGLLSSARAHTRSLGRRAQKRTFFSILHRIAKLLTAIYEVYDFGAVTI